MKTRALTRYEQAQDKVHAYALAVVKSRPRDGQRDLFPQLQARMRLGWVDALGVVVELKARG